MIISRFHNFRFFCVMSEFQCVHNSQQITYVRAGIKEVYRTQRSKSHPSISHCSALICQLLLLWVVFGDVFQVLHFLFDKSQDFLQTLLLEKWKKKVHNAPAHIAWKWLKSLIFTTLRVKRANMQEFQNWKKNEIFFKFSNIVLKCQKKAGESVWAVCFDCHCNSYFFIGKMSQHYFLFSDVSPYNPHE